LSNGGSAIQLCKGVKQLDSGNIKQNYQMPAEWGRHAGTWLNWPHQNTLKGYQIRLESIWLQIVQELQEHEHVHIVAYDEGHRDHINAQLSYFGIGLEGISFYIIPTNDVWARDCGAVFVRDVNNRLAVTDWPFNGWGNRFQHELDAREAAAIGESLDFNILTPPLVLEGGSIEVNGYGTFMGTRSSIMNTNRNPGRTQTEIEHILSKYLGVNHFIWLTGVGNEAADNLGGVTDTHVDGTARFTNESTVLYSWAEDKSDPRYSLYLNCFKELQAAILPSGKPLDLIALPIPKDGVHQVTPVSWRKTNVTPASYCNYYVANGVVLVPVFGNVNDARAKSIIADQFPDREVIGINVLNLIEYGGAVHCVTQQQPEQ
jgi:agmatine deiminase